MRLTSAIRFLNIHIAGPITKVKTTFQNITGDISSNIYYSSGFVGKSTLGQPVFVGKSISGHPSGEQIKTLATLLFNEDTGSWTFLEQMPTETRLMCLLSGGDSGKTESLLLKKEPAL